MQSTLIQVAAFVVPMVLAIVFHEVAHGWVACALGDPTAQERHRLSLNPLRHIDPFGTVVLPGMLALANLPIFGWAKPVPVDMRRLDHPRFGMMVVAAAGPITNLVMAAAGAVLLGLLGRQGSTGALTDFAALALDNLILINIFLAFFNLLPIPPFDGSHIVEGVLPRDVARRFARLRPFGLGLMFLLLLVVPYLWPNLGIVRHLVMPPVLWAADHFFSLAQAIAGG